MHQSFFLKRMISRGPWGSRWLDYPLLMHLLYSLKCPFSNMKGKLLEGCQNWRCVTCVDPMLYGVCMADTHMHLKRHPATLLTALSPTPFGVYWTCTILSQRSVRWPSMSLDCKTDHVFLAEIESGTSVEITNGPRERQ